MSVTSNSHKESKKGIVYQKLGKLKQIELIKAMQKQSLQQQKLESIVSMRLQTQQQLNQADEAVSHYLIEGMSDQYQSFSQLALALDNRLKQLNKEQSAAEVEVSQSQQQSQMLFEQMKRRNDKAAEMIKAGYLLVEQQRIDEMAVISSAAGV